mmetsp:Transcript_32045/g.88272  ORF Transcript_32045/g.88272 Transcript_32045/m.88272 type:complete len:229 (+) Transcript_32045:295-981(+)
MPTAASGSTTQSQLNTARTAGLHLLLCGVPCNQRSCFLCRWQGPTPHRWAHWLLGRASAVRGWPLDCVCKRRWHVLGHGLSWSSCCCRPHLARPRWLLLVLLLLCVGKTLLLFLHGFANSTSADIAPLWSSLSRQRCKHRRWLTRLLLCPREGCASGRAVLTSKWRSLSMHCIKSASQDARHHSSMCHRQATCTKFAKRGGQQCTNPLLNSRHQPHLTGCPVNCRAAL